MRTKIIAGLLIVGGSAAAAIAQVPQETAPLPTATPTPAATATPAPDPSPVPLPSPTGTPSPQAR